jgi:AAA domain
MQLFICINSNELLWNSKCRSEINAQSLQELCNDAKYYSAIVAHDAPKVFDIIIQSCCKYGVDYSPIKLPLIDMNDINCFSKAESVTELMKQYYYNGNSIDPSPEQRDLMYEFEKGKNILCKAVAGAGKTTTLLLCTSRRPNATYLLLTYNKRLQLDVSQRIKENIKAQVMTYHSAAGKAYRCLIRNDEAIRKAVKYSPPAPQKFDVLMIDEAQDISIEYYIFIKYLILANPNCQIIIVGDELQAINGYRGARYEFLTKAYHIYPSERKWVTCRLSTSYRLTPAIANFVNNHLYRAPIIVSGNVFNKNILPQYIVTTSDSPINIAKVISNAVNNAMQIYGPEGIFILAPSVRNLSGKSPIAELIRRFLINIPTFVSSDDSEVADSKVLKGKLAIISFNSSKGCERPCVILAGFDESYFQYYEKNWKVTDRLPNVLTVAATRASAQLIVIANRDKTLRTINYSTLGADANISFCQPSRPKICNPLNKKLKRSVTDVIRHLHPETISLAMQLFTYRSACTLTDKLSQLRVNKIPNGIIKFNTLYEDLNFVYGMVGPVLAEIKRTDGCTQFDKYAIPNIVDKIDDIKPLSNDITIEEYSAYPPGFWEELNKIAISDKRSNEDWVRIAIAKHALEGGRHHIARQVTNYDWIDNVSLENSRDTILFALDGIHGIFEFNLDPQLIIPNNGNNPVEIFGRVDFIDTTNNVIWEFKNVTEIDELHYIQLACYLALKKGGRGILLSVLRREAWEVYVSPDDAPQLLNLLVAKSRAPELDIMELIDRFEYGVVDYVDEEEDDGDDIQHEWELVDIYD